MSDPDEPESVILKNLRRKQKQISGEYPEGRLNTQDEGALTFAVGHEKGLVKIMFPKPVAWFAFTPEQAIDIANLLIQNARDAGLSVPVTINL